MGCVCRCKPRTKPNFSSHSVACQSPKVMAFLGRDPSNSGSGKRPLPPSLPPHHLTRSGLHELQPQKH